MSIPRLAIERPVTMFMLSGVIILIGALSLMRLPVDLMPDISYPSITVRVGYPGVGPLEMEELVTRPLEQAPTTGRPFPVGRDSYVLILVCRIIVQETNQFSCAFALYRQAFRSAAQQIVRSRYRGEVAPAVGSSLNNGFADARGDLPLIHECCRGAADRRHMWPCARNKSAAVRAEFKVSLPPPGTGNPILRFLNDPADGPQPAGTVGGNGNQRQTVR